MYSPKIKEMNSNSYLTTWKRFYLPNQCITFRCIICRSHRCPDIWIGRIRWNRQLNLNISSSTGISREQVSKLQRDFSAKWIIIQMKRKQCQGIKHWDHSSIYLRSLNWLRAFTIISIRLLEWRSTCASTQIKGLTWNQTMPLRSQSFHKDQNPEKSWYKSLTA